MLKTTTSIIQASQIATPITLPGDVTLSTGNLVIGTSGKGIDFSATAGTGTSELLADYEEGTWTPTINSAGGAVAYVSQSGSYTKIGNLITFNLYINFNIGTATGSLSIGLGALPAQKTGTTESNWAVVYTRGFVFPANKTALYIYKYPTNAAALLQWQDALGTGGTSVDAGSITAAFGSPEIMISGSYLTD